MIIGAHKGSDSWVGLGLGLSKPDFGTKGYLIAMRTIFLDNFDSCIVVLPCWSLFVASE